jgi:tetratricopeptide (TPR) repeat protein
MARESKRCPKEAQLFSYFEGTLGFRARKRTERHLAGCDSCRDSLVLLAREASGEASTPVDKDDSVKDQAATVLRMAERDEERRRLRPDKPHSFAPTMAGVAAFLMLAVGAGVVYRLYLSDSPTEEGWKALRTAVSKNRRIPLRISGGLPYAPYLPLPRGGASSDDLSYDIAGSRLSFALDSAAPAPARLSLARFYLARAEPGDSEKALRLLDELASGGKGSAEILNETGIANFQLGRYQEAISNFTGALEVAPKMPEALFNRAYAEERVDGQAALDDWERFVASTSDSDWIAEARARLAAFGKDGN